MRSRWAIILINTALAGQIVVGAGVHFAGSDREKISRHRTVCDLIASHCAVEFETGRREALQALADSTVERNPDVSNVTIRDADQRAIAIANGNPQRIAVPTGHVRADTVVVSPVVIKGAQWGDVSITFTTTTPFAWNWFRETWALGAFAIVMLMGLFPWFMDVLSRRSSSVVARDCSGATHNGTILQPKTVEALERRNAQLQSLLDELKQARARLHRSNTELTALATRDPLTSCLNRRAFLGNFDNLWQASDRYNHNLCCVLLDIDHFKLVNDTHGHSVGDQVLQQVASALAGQMRPSDRLCRYGGEEFCVLLPHIDIEGAAVAAERYRLCVEELNPSNIRITISAGVAEKTVDLDGPPALIDAADEALYAAKDAGRNRVMRADQLSDARDLQRPETGDEPVLESPPQIPFQAVISLVSALAHRDALTAEHSRRVADLCVTVAHGLLSARDCYVLEVAALLHDIGKLGVPDAILHKASTLTPEEWKVMRSYSDMSVDITSSAFDCAALTEIIRYRTAKYSESSAKTGAPSGADIPLGARILAIADAYDSMISDHVYRAGVSCQEALVELRRCGGGQFDPELVERFIDAIVEGDEIRRSPVGNVSKPIALQIGLQIERITCALDAHDTASLTILARGLEKTASENGIDEIRRVAHLIEVSAAEGANWFEIASWTHELLELCRATQSTYLPSACLTDSCASPTVDLQAT